MVHSLSAICLFLLLVKLKLSHKLSAVVAFLFFSNVAAFEKVTWISNFQHTSYHLFLVLSALFLILNVDTYGLKKMMLVASSVISWICVLLSNMAGIFLPLILMLLLVIKVHQDKGEERKKIVPLLVKGTSPHWLILLIWLIVILIPNWKRVGPDDPYYIDISIKTLMGNLHYYSSEVFLPNAKGLYLIVLAVLYALFFVPQVIRKMLLKKELLFNFIIIILISGFTYAPFAFLEYQKYPNYVSLTLIPLYIIILFPLFNRERLADTGYTLKKVITVLFVCLFIVSFLPNKRQLIMYFKNSPKLHILSVWNQTQSILPEIPKGVSKVVFVDNEPFDSQSSVTVWKIPPFWWYVGFNTMFRILYNRQDVDFSFSTDKIISREPNTIYIGVNKGPISYSLFLMS